MGHSGIHNQQASDAVVAANVDELKYIQFVAFDLLLLVFFFI